MLQFLCFTVHFLDPVACFNGTRDGGEAEWPPSPLRLYQALLDGAASHFRDHAFDQRVKHAMEWLETLKPPIIITPDHQVSVPFRIAVPNNDLDYWARPFAKGLDPKKKPNELKTMKTVRRVRLLGSSAEFNAIRYLLSITDDAVADHLDTLKTAARCITHLGWGVDVVAADVALVSAIELTQLHGHRWECGHGGGTSLRIPRVGTFQALLRRHQEFLSRLSAGGFTPVLPFTAFERVSYRRSSDSISRPHAVFKLIDENDDAVAYAQAKLVHIAGMVKHLAIEQMKRNPPRDLRGRSKEQWIEEFVAGHQSKHAKDAGIHHTQFSYIPLQSVSPYVEHTDPGVRRVMIVAPVGDEAWLEHLAVRLDGALLKPLPGTKLPQGTRLELISEKRKDGVRDAYLRASINWSSVTPVILPGHDDHRPEKTRKLIEKALAQSGIEQPCEFEWSAFSRFRKMLPAHKYRKDPSDPSKKILINYVRPDHLLEQSAVHLTMRFNNSLAVPGPLTIGAGRHCGFGLMAAIDD